MNTCNLEVVCANVHRYECGRPASEVPCSPGEGRSKSASWRIEAWIPWIYGEERSVRKLGSCIPKDSDWELLALYRYYLPGLPPNESTNFVFLFLCKDGTV